MMKKLFLAAAVVALFAGVASAQNFRSGITPPPTYRGNVLATLDQVGLPRPAAGQGLDLSAQSVFMPGAGGPSVILGDAMASNATPEAAPIYYDWSHEYYDVAKFLNIQTAYDLVKQVDYDMFASSLLDLMTNIKDAINQYGSTDSLVKLNASMDQYSDALMEHGKGYDYSDLYRSLQNAWAAYENIMKEIGLPGYPGSSIGVFFSYIGANNINLKNGGFTYGGGMKGRIDGNNIFGAGGELLGTMVGKGRFQAVAVKNPIPIIP